MPDLPLDARSLWVYLGLSVILGGAASFSAGRALALGWRPLAKGILYALMIAAAARFLHYALFAEPLLSLSRYGLDLAPALGFVLAGFRLTRRRQMKQQYGAILAQEDQGAAHRVRGNPS